MPLIETVIVIGCVIGVCLGFCILFGILDRCCINRNRNDNILFRRVSRIRF